MEKSLFTKEQIEELNNISKLKEEEQKKVLPEFLKKLSPEQIEYLKQQQAPQCPFCLIAENKIKSKKIYEDNDIIAVLDINPANPGHTIVFPKTHYQILAQIKDISNLFNAVNKISSLLFDSLKATGTNILISNGVSAGQTIPHVIVNIIPRYNNDNVKLNLEHKKVSDEELDNILNKIKGKPAVEHVKKPEIKNKAEKLNLKFKENRMP